MSLKGWQTFERCRPFSPYLWKRPTSSSLLSVDKIYIFTALFQGYTSSPALHQNRSHDCQSPLPSTRHHGASLYWWHGAGWTQWVRSSNYSMLVGKTFMCQRVKINLTNIQRTSTSVKLLGVQWYGICQESPLKKMFVYLAILSLSCGTYD